MQAELCALMANPKRLMIMDFLSRKGEASVGDMAEELEVSVSTVSQHLRLMRDKNIVLCRKEGHTVYYWMKHPKLMEGCHAVQAVLMDELRGTARMAEHLEEQNEKS
ncbi:MAG: winged helix-turn-helix transcriptional regulator [Lentisphaerae bacterium]|nr:winged helix-turn-helix transcriptional regulator [Lentisphaerota bacterium]